MSVALLRNVSSSRTLLLYSQNVDIFSKYIIRNASKASGTPGIVGLGGKVGKVTAAAVNVKISVLPVETNLERLSTHVCGSNLLKEGGEDTELKPDNEYPEWLWKLNLGRKPHYSQLTPNDAEYWRQLKHIHNEQQKRIKARKRF